ncbi:MAG: rhomboid family intramembrane serine protease [Planctomycetota bacterium]
MGIFDRDYMQSSDGTGSMIRSMSAVKLIVAINIAVFIAWHVAPRNFMQYEFMTSWLHLSTGRIWTPLTAAFSHYSFFHILINMLVFLSFAPVLEARWGKARFLAFYLGAAVFSSLLHASMVQFGWRDAPALGASGAVCAVTTAFACYYPKNVILIWGILPAPAWLIVVAFSLFDLKGLIDQGQGVSTGVGHAAHLGGVVFALGLLFVLPRMGLTGSRKASSRPRVVARRDPGDYYPSAPSSGAAPDRDIAEEERLDELLTKVSREGIDALDDQEREDLNRISRKRGDLP